MLGTRADRHGELSPFHRALLEAGPRVGLPLLDDVNDSPTPPSASPGRGERLRAAVRWNTAFAY